MSIQLELPISTGGFEELGLELATSEFGVIISGITEASPASHEDISVGDCIVQVQRKLP